MVHMIWIVNGDQHIHIEQGQHQMSSAWRRRSMRSLVTSPPREGKGLMP